MSDIDDDNGFGVVLLDRGARKDDIDAEPAGVVSTPNWTTEGMVRFGEQTISLTSSQRDGAKARVLRTLQRYSLRPMVLAKNLDVSVHVLSDLARYALKLDARTCDHWRRCLGLDWDEFFDLKNEHVDRAPEPWEKPPAPPPPEKLVAKGEVITETVTSKSLGIYAGMSHEQRLLVLRNRRARDCRPSETELVSWQSASDQSECQLFRERGLGPDLFKVLNGTGLIRGNWLERRTPEGFDKAGLQPPDKRKSGVRETLVPASFVSRIVRFARTVSAGVDLVGQSHLEAELTRLEQFCQDCQVQAG